ncbi:hypothetical protein [Spirulina sp. 06S082]|nr:hypothetical protein [Spirulina sp. 06S082]MEA5469166.1 hypothetical protein [Spirulina sp. 06S082]
MSRDKENLLFCGVYLCWLDARTSSLRIVCGFCDRASFKVEEGDR